jgi:hypothetical protein
MVHVGVLWFLIGVLVIVDGHFIIINAVHCGPGSVVGIATAYGLDAPGIDSRRAEVFSTCPDRP